MEPKICTQMLKKMSKKLGAKFPANISSCSMVKIGHLDDSFLEDFSPQASLVKGQSLQQERRKREGEKSN